jgi:hypothetical protein
MTYHELVKLPDPTLTTSLRACEFSGIRQNGNLIIFSIQSVSVLKSISPHNLNVCVFFLVNVLISFEVEIDLTIILNIFDEFDPSNN